MEEKICAICGEPIYENEEFRTVNGDAMHYECLVDSDDYEYCDACGNWVDAHETRIVYGRNDREIHVCDDCIDESAYFYCECCNEYYISSEVNLYYTNDGDTLCEGCYDEHYGECYDCEHTFHNDDLYWNEDLGEYLCSDCTQRRDRARDKIHNYGYKPTPVFKSMTLHDRFIVGADIKEPTLGVELEIDKGRNRFDCAEELVDASEDIYCKEDSSLSCGIEIVSHPATLDYHLEGLGWDKLIDIAKKYDFKSHDARTCGLHVHVGRTQLGIDDAERKKTITKIMLFVVRHWNNLVKFSRREAGQLEHWAMMPKFGVIAQDFNLTVDNAMRTWEMGRYQAVNLTNTNTVEFRIFNGTLKKETLFATLQLVDNLCRWAKAATFADALNSSWIDVQKFKQYDELDEYCASRDIDIDDVSEFPRGVAIGSKVRVTTEYDALRGFTGTVECIHRNHYGVTFRNLTPEARMIMENTHHLHDLDGNLIERVGRWYNNYEIALIEEEM